MNWKKPSLIALWSFVGLAWLGVATGAINTSGLG